jgi:fibrillarin-like rRNA methylase
MDDENVVDLVAYRKIKSLEKHIKELNEITPILKSAIKDLTTYEKYSSIRRRIEDLFVLYQDIKRSKKSKIETLARLKNER